MKKLDKAAKIMVTVVGLLFVAVLLVLFAKIAEAAEISADPTIAGQHTLTINCTMPLTREDGTVLATSEIAKVSFFVKKFGEIDSAFAAAGENQTSCFQIYDLTSVVDGTYVYAATITDTSGRESQYSDSRLTAIVKRLALPSPPSGLSGAVN